MMTLNKDETLPVAAGLHELFFPRSIAHIGASPKPAPGRFAFLEYIQKMGYEGALYPVNPSYREMLGLVCFPDLASIPGPVDMAILALPAAMSVAILRQAPRGKVKFVVIHTSGFSEIDKGYLEDELIELGKAKGFRMIGPNCMGVFNRRAKICFWNDHAELADRPGSVGWISQSGGLALTLMSRAIDLGIGIEKAVSLGNQIDVSIAETMEYFAEDEAIRVIAAYVEDVKDGRRFLETVRRITPQKPVLVWKGGVTAVGRDAARTHTGSMAGNAEIFAAALRQAGAVRIDNHDQMLIALKVLERPDRLPGRNLLLVCPGGGMVVNVSDAFSAQPNLSLPRLSPECQARLQEMVPQENVDLKNPVDPGAVGMTKLGKIIETAGREPDIDSVLTIGNADFLQMLPNDQVRELVIQEMVHTVSSSAKAIEKPFYFYIMPVHDDPVSALYRRLLRQRLEDQGVPCLGGPYYEIARVFSRLAGMQRRADPQ